MSTRSPIPRRPPTDRSGLFFTLAVVVGLAALLAGAVLLSSGTCARPFHVEAVDGSRADDGQRSDRGTADSDEHGSKTESKGDAGGVDPEIDFHVQLGMLGSGMLSEDSLERALKNVIGTLTSYPRAGPLATVAAESGAFDGLIDLVGAASTGAEGAPSDATLRRSLLAADALYRMADRGGQGTNLGREAGSDHLTPLPGRRAAAVQAMAFKGAAKSAMGAIRALPDDTDVAEVMCNLLSAVINREVPASIRRAQGAGVVGVLLDVLGEHSLPLVVHPALVSLAELAADRDARAEMVERGLPRTLARVLDAHRKSPLVVGAIASAAGMMTSEESDAATLHALAQLGVMRDIIKAVHTFASLSNVVESSLQLIVNTLDNPEFRALAVNEWGVVEALVEVFRAGSGAQATAMHVAMANAAAPALAVLAHFSDNARSRALDEGVLEVLAVLRQRAPRAPGLEQAEMAFESPAEYAVAIRSRVDEYRREQERLASEVGESKADGAAGQQSGGMEVPK